MTVQSSSSFFHRPRTRLGWWAAGFFVVFVILFIINAVVFVPAAQGVLRAERGLVSLPNFGILLMLCGLAGGILGLIAVIKKHERSWLVWLTILPLVFILFIIIGEFVIPH